jgi:uncharacterized protein YndB with AHSA1/START domain
MQKTINHKVFFAQAPQEVWEYLTRPELLELWLMKTDLQPTVGHQFQFMTRPMPGFDFDGNFYCTMLEVTPFTKLSYSWKGGPGGGRITLDSVVEWILHPKDNGTELEIVHSGFKEMENLMMYAAMNDGWLKNMNKIVELINNAKNGTTNP